MGLRKDVSKIEFVGYVGVWSSAVVYSIYCFARISNKRFEHYNDLYSDFDQGWSFLSRKKDVGDYEWRAIKWLLKTLSWWVISSTIISDIIRHFHFTQILPLWQILISVAFVLKELGIYVFGILLFQPLLFFLILSTTHKKSFIWMSSAVALFSITIFKYWCASEEHLNILNLNPLSFYLTSISISWMNLRCLSCSIYIIDSNERWTNIKFFAYLLYLPNLISGPFISFEDFQSCYQISGDIYRRVFDLLANIARFLFWFTFGEFFLHFVYVNAMNFHPEWIELFGSVSLYGYGYTMGQFFHIKYIILYGLSTIFPKFENVKVPSLPVCIGRIHLYSDMWKYFDAGLYNFLSKYIYIPLLKSQLIKTRLLASLICFVFVFVWHGVEYYILLWSMLNYIGIVLEYFGKCINDNFLQKMDISKKIGHKWFRRITCLISAPLLAMSAISNFIFFAGEEVGNIFISRILNDGLKKSVILLVLLSACCQISTEARYQQHKTRKQKSN